jgi:hypothetical protein
MANYPDWVMEHKKKGTYVNCVKGKYYLYAAHSERVKGTNKVKRISDGYLGRITQEDGLIPPKEKVTGPIIVLEYGLSTTILSLCGNIHKGMRRSFTKSGDLVMVASILACIYGEFNNLVLSQTYLSYLFSDLDMDDVTTKAQNFGIERGRMMIQDTLSNYFGEDLPSVLALFPLIYKVRINGRIYQSEEPTPTKELKLKYNLKWEE